MDENEPLDKAAARELQEETGVNPADVLLTQASCILCWLGRPQSLPVCQLRLFAARGPRAQQTAEAGTSHPLHLTPTAPAGWGVWRPWARPARLVRVRGICSPRAHNRAWCAGSRRCAGVWGCVEWSGVSLAHDALRLGTTLQLPLHVQRPLICAVMLALQPLHPALPASD